MKPTRWGLLLVAAATCALVCPPRVVFGGDSLDTSRTDLPNAGGFRWTVGAIRADSGLVPPRSARATLVPTSKWPEVVLQHTAGDITREVAGAPLGAAWTEWLDTTYVAGCQAFRGSSYSLNFGEYWLMQCWRRARMLGAFRYRAYFLDEAGPPRLGVIEWGVRASDKLTRQDVRMLAGYLLDSLKVGLQTESPLDDSRPPVFGSSGLLLMAQLRSDAGMLRLWREPEDPLVEPDSLLLIYWSNGFLEAEATPTAMPLDAYFYDDRDPMRGIRAELAEYLREDWLSLVSVLERDSVGQEDLETLQASLDRARSTSQSREVQDAVALAAHMSLQKFEAKFAWEDSASINSLQRLFENYGAGFSVAHYGGFCYDHGLTRALWARPCDNLWTQAAFLERQRHGWVKPCGYCENEGPSQYEYESAIARGQAFLEECPASPLRWEILLTLAEAHETAWSLGKAADDDEFTNWARHSLQAPTHRERALALYREILASGPPELATPWMKGRLRRMELDVDTSFRKYWCVGC